MAEVGRWAGILGVQTKVGVAGLREGIQGAARNDALQPAADVPRARRGRDAADQDGAGRRGEGMTVGGLLLGKGAGIWCSSTAL